MDKAVLRNFAIESRKDLMEKIDRKIKLFYIDEEFKKDNRGDVIVLSNDKHTLTLTRDEDLNRDKLIKRIVELGYNQVVEEAAYTWFNRIIAIRYMELHDYLPLTNTNQSLGIRILSSQDNTVEPEILKFSNLSNRDLDISFDLNVYTGFKNEDEKFKYVLLLVCKKISKVIPQIFGGITDYIDLLIPDNMLNDNGFINNVINNISVDNFSEVEIIGWLYQYYNQTEKDRVISAKKAKSKNDLAYATQLFTPDWIVKYMVDNSLGRYWIKNSNSSELESKMNYYIKGLEETNINKNINLEKIKIIDPCCGSGHILVYAFDILYNMYLECGYNKREIAYLILKNNLFGLDIDDRAGQLSILSVLLKAREYDKDIFNKDIISKMNIMSICDTENFPHSLLDELSPNSKSLAEELVVTFRHAKEIGSLLKIEPKDYSILENEIMTLNNIFTYELRDRIIPLISLAKILSNKYEAIVTNPPYLSNNAMTPSLKDYVFDKYQITKTDLFACFIDRCNELITEDGYSALVTMQSWMFLSSFSDFREKIINNYNIKSLMHMDNNVMHIAFGTCATIFEKKNSKSTKGMYFEIKNQNLTDDDIPYEFPVLNNVNVLKEIDDFKKIPGLNIAYWITDNLLDAFENGKPFSEYADMFQGIITGDNEKFLRLWYELDINKISLHESKMSDIDLSQKYWIPYNKGGSFRKWYGNQDYVVNWKNGPDDKTRGKKSFENYYLREYVSWSYITSSTLASRYFPKGFLWDVAGSGFFDKTNNMKYLHALLGSIVGINILKIINPTINYQVENVAVIPVLFPDVNSKNKIELLVDECIRLSKKDWDSCEISWDFKSPSYIKTGNLNQLFDNYINECKYDYDICNKNEEEINQILLNTYNFKDNKYKVNDTTIRIPTKKALVKELISYSVGCMFGRYSVDNSGLIFGGGTYDDKKYITIVPDSDNIIPISDDSTIYYNDDLVGRFEEFIKKVFGAENYNKNIEFIAEMLGKKGTELSEETIRRYFAIDFYSDHLKLYQKRPIYWMFDSGKKNGFKCLVYLHRYNEQIVSKIRTKYLHNTISIYQRIVEEIDYKLNNEELNITDKRELQNKKADLNGKIAECNEYEEMVGNVANKMIKLDLDDGVFANYAKFVDDNGKSILAKIK